MGSRGSVIPILLKQNKNLDYFTITDKRMTRFNITLDEAIKFVNNCISKMKGKEIFVPKSPSYKIMDLVKAINKNKKIKIIGIRRGEKIHEELINKAEYFYSIEKKDKFILLPIAKKNKPKKSVNSSYNSFTNKKYLSILNIRKLISTNISDLEK